MKRLFLASVIMALPFAAAAADLSGQYSFIGETLPPAPAPGVIGQLEVGVTWTHIDFDDPESFDQAWIGDGWGRVNVPFAGNWNVELEAGGRAWYPRGADDYWFLGGYGHLWTDMAGYRIGVVGGAGYLEDYVTLYSAGLEGEADVGNAVFGAQAIYNYHAYESAVGQSDAQSAGARGWVDYYMTPNTRLHGEVAYWWYDFSESGAPDWSLTGGAALEHRFGMSPLSAFGSVKYTASELSGIDFNRLDLMTGFRLFFDPPSMTLEQHDRQLPFAIDLPKFL